MKFQDDILLNELQSLSPLLAGLEKTTVFFVPEGYFENLSNAVLICIKEDIGITNNSKLDDVPEGYFENFPAAILNKIKAQQKNTVVNDLEEPSESLRNIKQKELFEVPNGYFENLAVTILNKLKVAEKSTDTEESILSGSIQSLDQKTFFDVPAGYFENLSVSILDKIKAGASSKEEIKKLSPLMESLQQVNVFEVPEEYFSTVQGNIINAAKATTVTTAKVVSMPKTRSFFRYAAAAVITGVMALGVYKYTNKPAINAPVPTLSFAKLDSSIEKGKAMNEDQFNEALNSLTKEDITSYLEKNGSDEDISLLTNNVEVNDLPSKDDYLLDEKTLENYLDKIKFQN